MTIAGQHARALTPVEYLPDIAAGLIIGFMSTRVAGVGPLFQIAWLGVFGLLLLARRKDALSTLWRWWPLLLLPLLAFLSFIWSDVAVVSARYGFQLLLTAFVGLLIARVLTPERFTVVLFVTMLVYCVVSVLYGRQGMAEDGMVLIGLSGSKNEMAGRANVLVAAAFAMLMMPTAPRILKLLSVFGIAIGGFIILTTDSATAVLMAIAGIGVFLLFCWLQKATPAVRLGGLIVTVCVLAPVAMLWPEIQEAINRFTVEVLHKDPTLTGRTYLWARADELIARRPLLGYGYQAIWLGESSDTIGLLRWSGQIDGRVYNFHNTYRQIGVDTGLIGVGVLLLTFLIATLVGLRQFLVTPSIATSFLFVYFLLTLAKSNTEMIVGPFQTQTVLLMACLYYMFWRPQAPAQQPTLAPSRRFASSWRP